MVEWIAGRLDGSLKGKETPIGIIPAEDELNLDGLDLDKADVTELLSVPAETWKQELESMSEFLESFGMRLPAKLKTELEHTRELLGFRKQA